MVDLQYIFRNPSPAFNSIENVFNSIIPWIEKEFSVCKDFSPKPSSSLFNIYTNWKTLKASDEGRVRHITGHDYYLALTGAGNMVLTVHDTLSAFTGSALRDAVIRRYWFRLPMKKARFITVVSRSSMEEIKRFFPGSDDRLRYIPNPVNEVFTHHPAEFNIKEPLILHVGTKKNKNLETTAEALRGISCRLAILGNPGAAQQNLLKSYKIRFESYQNLSYEKVAELYRSCDMLSFASLYEGFGMPILEAQATGRPVLTSNISAMAEVAGNSACLVDPHDSNSIRIGIQKIIGNKEYREELVERGSENVKKFSAEKIAKMYIDLYREMLCEE